MLWRENGRELLGLCGEDGDERVLEFIEEEIWMRIYVKWLCSNY